MSITRAVIPAAGRGTRMQPASLAYPKELIALGATPALDFVLEEAAAAGICDVCLVVAPGKGAIRRYLEERQEGGSFAGLRFAWAQQPEPLGLADAISVTRDFAADEPFALLLPDNVLLSPEYRLASLLETQLEHGGHVVGVLELDSAWSGLYGNCGRFDGAEVADGVYRIERLHDKESGLLEVGAGAVVRRTCGRYVCHPEVFEVIERQRSASPLGELDEVPVYQEISRRGNLRGVRLPLPLFDVGQPDGCLAAAAYLSARRRSSAAAARRSDSPSGKE